MEFEESDIHLNISTSVEGENLISKKLNMRKKKKLKKQNEDFSEPEINVHNDFSDTPRQKSRTSKKTYDNSTDKHRKTEGRQNSETKQKYKSSSGKVSSLFGNNPAIPPFARRMVNPVQETVFSNTDFKDLPIHKFSVSNLQSLGLNQLTTVQQKAIPVILEGNDALVRSQTGSGKTLAYALPIVEALQKIRPELTRTDGVHALVVVPTRELALQTYEWFIKLVKPFMRLVPGYLVGGEKRKSEKARLRKGITILVGTPGRLVDHVSHTRSLNLSHVKWLVLDEADRLLDMGYERDVASLVSAMDSQDPNRRLLPHIGDQSENKKEKCRQTILLSATLTPALERLAGLALHSPIFVDAADKTLDDAETMELSIPDKLVQYYIVTPAKLRLVTLAAFIVWKCQLTTHRKMLLFCATQDMVDYFTELFTSVLSRSDQDDDDSDDEGSSPTVDVEFFHLHGNMSQKERTEVFKAFRSADSGVLLCTDVAARGLDLPHVDLIIQYNGPCTVRDYVHRVGRTARVDTAGSAILFLTPSEMEFIRRLEDHSIRLQEEKMDRCLEKLMLVGCSSFSKKAPPSSPEAAATALQTRFEVAVMEQRKLHDLACKAYVSWVRFYASYPKNIRDVFSFKALHLGHHAKSFALRDPPSTIGGIGRRQHQRQGDNSSRKRKTHDGASRKEQPGKVPPSHKRTRELVLSEYASGLEPLKKKNKKSSS
ncbi:ATP-dependent DNA helicase DDX31 [Anabrus simplex]|uniref:ATP-dependent DNA helicase DDX31 n=1 Tax=Anabrus simplex TaxID=316456 RepID=UPI0035A33298